MITHHLTRRLCWSCVHCYDQLQNIEQTLLLYLILLPASPLYNVIHITMMQTKSQSN